MRRTASCWDNSTRSFIWKVYQKPVSGWHLLFTVLVSGRRWTTTDSGLQYQATEIAVLLFCPCLASGPEVYSFIFFFSMKTQQKCYIWTSVKLLPVSKFSVCLPCPSSMSFSHQSMPTCTAAAALYTWHTALALILTPGFGPVTNRKLFPHTRSVVCFCFFFSLCYLLIAIYKSFVAPDYNLTRTIHILWIN